MAAVGFRRVGGTYAIFCPLVVSSGMKASPSRATVLPRLEGLFRASGAGGLMLACQMHLLQKPS